MPFQICRDCFIESGETDERLVPTTLIKQIMPDFNARLYIFCDRENRAVLVDSNGSKVK